ncbi:MAG: hypothetical protein LCI00_30710 [Chloroflexi bacterium]|nr:hypothetical protein [Chloroflexota bacterium]MCC6894765.1 PD40 domain-containing protein [Anaerolineae bacterium]
MLVITGWYCKFIVVICTVQIGLMMAAQSSAQPTHQITFIGSGRERYGVYIMDMSRRVIAPYVRESVIGRQTDSTWSPDFNTLVFRAVQNITIDLYAIDLGSDQYRQITGTGKNNHSPTFSPDGQWLAFTSERDGNPEIYVISASCILPDARCRDDAARRLTDHPKADDQAAWSPDSQQLAFQSNRDGDFEIYTMNRDGSNQSRLTHSPRNDLLPNWSPDGQQIAFASERDINAELYVMQTDGSDPRRLTQTRAYEFTPQWSPDGRYILFQRAVPGSDFETYVIHADGSGEQRLTTVRMFLQNPVWRS